MLCGTNSKEEQWWIQWISTEQHRYLHGPQLCKKEINDFEQVRNFLVYRKNLFAFVKEQQWLIQWISPLISSTTQIQAPEVKFHVKENFEKNHDFQF
jgi:hypothetical protein